MQGEQLKRLLDCPGTKISTSIVAMGDLDDVIQSISRFDNQSDNLTHTDARPEAIVVKCSLRPAELIQDSTIQQPSNTDWKQVLQHQKSNVESYLVHCGAILAEEDGEWIVQGSGLRIGKQKLLTNKHVADVVLMYLQEGRRLRVDFDKEFDRVSATIVDIVDVESIDNNEEVDLAVLTTSANDLNNKPINTFASLGQTVSDPNVFEAVATIGFPTEIRQISDQPEVKDVFKKIYDVKRFQPGLVREMDTVNNYFSHDCSTHPGNSGSILVSLESGLLVGIHFDSDVAMKRNYALKISTVREWLVSRNLIPTSA